MNDKIFGAIRDIATNFSFALGPAGPFASGIISALFDLFGGGGEDIAAEIQSMINEAVQQLESYMNQLKVDEVSADIQTFFNWYFEQAQAIDAKAVLDDATIRNYETPGTGVFAQLEGTSTWQTGSLANNVVQLSQDNFTQPDQWVAPDQDSILATFMFALTAMAASIKMRINLYGAAAHYYRPGADGACESLDFDSRYQGYTMKFLDAVAALESLLRPLDPGTASQDQQDALALGQVLLANWNANRNTLAAPFNEFLDGLKPIPGDAPGNWTDYIHQKYFAVRYLDHRPPDGLQPLVPATLSVSDWISISPATGIEALIYRRLQVAARQVNVAHAFIQKDLHYLGYGTDGIYIVSSDQDKLLAVQAAGGRNGYYGFDSDHVFPPGTAPDVLSSYDPGRQQVFPDSALDDATQAWQNELLDDQSIVFAGIGVGIFGNGNTASAPHLIALDNIRQMRQGLASLRTQLPPDAPANVVTLHNWAPDTDTPPATSKWSTAVDVRYAIAYVNDNGSSLRSDWGPMNAVKDAGKARWKPELHHLNDDVPAGVTHIELWRQFITNDVNGDPASFGLPYIVATVPASQGIVIDTEPGMTAMA